MDEGPSCFGPTEQALKTPRHPDASGCYLLVAGGAGVRQSRIDAAMLRIGITARFYLSTSL